MKAVGLNPSNARKIREGGFKKFISNFRKHREEVESKKEEGPEKEGKSSLAGNICCGVFILIFLLFLVHSKLNEEFWRVYKTRGQEVEVSQSKKLKKKGFL